MPTGKKDNSRASKKFLSELKNYKKEMYIKSSHNFSSMVGTRVVTDQRLSDFK